MIEDPISMDPEEQRELFELLMQTHCILCPNVIGLNDFTAVTAPDVVEAWMREHPLADLVCGPRGERLLLVHVNCLKNADMVNRLRAEDGGEDG